MNAEAAGRKARYFARADSEAAIVLLAEKLKRDNPADERAKGWAWRADVLEAFQQTINLAPRLGATPETPPRAELYYRLVAEFVRRYHSDARDHHSDARDRSPTALSPGLLIDAWDIWKKRLGDGPDGAKGHGGIVEPDLVRAALCECNADVARWLLKDDKAYGDEAALREQIRRQLRRLLHTQADADRAVLYELMRLFHYRFAARETGQNTDIVECLIENAKHFQSAVKSLGETPLPKALEADFRNSELDSHINDAESRTIDVLQAAFSHGLRGDDDNLSGLPLAIREAAATFGSDPCYGGEPAEFERILRRVLLYWAARSRTIRRAFADLLGYEFPQRESPPPGRQDASAVCDCWVAVVGYRQRGKTTFMRSLAAASMPDGTALDAAAETILPDGATQRGVDWEKSRVRLLRTEAFRDAQSRAHVITESREQARQDLDAWLSLDDPAERKKEEGTKKRPLYIAEVGAAGGRLARLCFFDVMGESMHNRDIGEMDPDVRERLKRREPTAAIYIASEDREETKSNPVIAQPDAPVYIVINKIDEFMENYGKYAEDEMRQSLGYSDAPHENDADYGWNGEAFVSFRGFDLEPKGDTTPHRQLLRQLDDSPSLLRRPHYHARVRADIQRLGWLVDDLAKTRRDISLVYLASIPGGRRTPEEFRGLRRLWEDLEDRVVRSTSRSRRTAFRQLLVDTPVEYERKAAEAYGRFDAVLSLRKPDGADAVSGRMPELSGNWQELEKSIRAVTVRRNAPTESWTEEPPFAALLQSFQALKHGLKWRRNLRESLREALDGFLPEFGVDPERQLHTVPSGRVLEEGPESLADALGASIEAVRKKWRARHAVAGSGGLTDEEWEEYWKESLREALDGFLPEFGVDPERQLGTAPRDGVLEEEPESLVGALEESIEAMRKECRARHAIAGSGDLTDEEWKEFWNRIRNAIRTARATMADHAPAGPGATASRGHLSEPGVTFDAAGKGAEIPPESRGMGAIAGPSHRRYLPEPLPAVSVGNVSVGNWLLDGASGRNANDGREIVEALYNMEDAKTARYPQLLLKSENEIDFERVRVLTGQSEDPELMLSTRLEKFQESALGTLGKLLDFYRQETDLSEEMLANAYMVGAIQSALPGMGLERNTIPGLGNGALPDAAGESGRSEPERGAETGQQPPGSPDMDPWGLHRFIEPGNVLLKKLALLANARSGIVGQAVGGGNAVQQAWDEIVEFRTENMAAWERLDFESFERAGEGKYSASRRDAVVAGIPGIEIKMRLLSALSSALDAVRKGLERIRDDRPREDAKRGLENTRSAGAERRGMSGGTAARNAGGYENLGWRTDAHLPFELERLRIARRVLIAGYPLRYLGAKGWLTEAVKIAEAEAPDSPVAFRLRRAYQALNRATAEFKKACRKVDAMTAEVGGSGAMARPEFTLLKLTEPRADTKDPPSTVESWLDDSGGNWQKLLEELQLFSTEGAPELWGEDV